MKRIIRIALSFLLALSILCISVTVFYAETIFVSGDYSYTLLEEDYVSIYSWDGTDTLTIPAMLDNYRVKEIRNGCFNGRSDFTVVSFVWADNLNRIGYNAFKNTAISGTVNIPPQVSTIGASAFQNCDGIETLYYNAMSNVISTQCFYDCDMLSEVYIADSVNTIESHAFSSCDNLKVIRIPEKVTSIAETAFDGDLDLVIYCYTDSYAHQYAVDNGIDYVLIDGPSDPTEPTVPTVPTAATEATVPTETAATEPTVATEPPTTAPEGYILGDADNSGNVDVVDATFAQRYVTQSEIPAEILKGIDVRADVDSNGDVEATDVTFIMRHLIRVKVPYPIGELITI